MSTVIERAPERQQQDINPTRMVHIGDTLHPEYPYVALCGARLRGHHRDGDPLDCAVCADLAGEA